MNAYIIRYTMDGVDKQMVRKAVDATEAIERLCYQYGWNYHLNMYDADTRGIDWSECFVDRDGGINFSMRMVASRKKMD